MSITFPKSILLTPKIPNIAVVVLLAAEFLFMQNLNSQDPYCTLKVEHPHYSTSLKETKGIDAIKLNITTKCNVAQKYTQVSTHIQKIRNEREVTAFSFENRRKGSTFKAPNVVSFKELFAPCKKGPSVSYRGVVQGFVYLASGKKLSLKGDSGKFVVVECSIGAQ